MAFALRSKGLLWTWMDPDPGKRPFFATGRSVAKAIGAFVSFVGTVLGALAVVGVFGGSGDGEGALARAAEKTTDAGSSEVAIRTTLGGEVTKAVGKIDYIAEVGQLDSPDGKLILQAPYIYARDPTSRFWCRHKLSFLGSGFLFGAITGFESDPAAALVNLEENGEYEEQGEEMLFGVNTTHYVGTVDIEQLIEAETIRKRRKALELLAPYNDSELPVEVWLDDEDLPRRITSSFRIPARTDVVFDFSEFGVNVATTPPSPTKTIPAGGRGCSKLPISEPGA